LPFFDIFFKATYLRKPLFIRLKNTTKDQLDNILFFVDSLTVFYSSFLGAMEFRCQPGMNFSAIGLQREIFTCFACSQEMRIRVSILYEIAI